MSTIEAADLARIILDDTETDRHMDLYTLTVIEARTLAHAVDAVAKLADRLDVIANELGADGEDGYAGYADAARSDAHSIRAALNGETA